MALVLSRRVGESIHIGDDVVVTVVEINKGQVRMVFTAPKSIKIMREELLSCGRTMDKLRRDSHG